MGRLLVQQLRVFAPSLDIHAGVGRGGATADNLGLPAASDADGCITCRGLMGLAV